MSSRIGPPGPPNILILCLTISVIALKNKSLGHFITSVTYYYNIEYPIATCIKYITQCIPNVYVFLNPDLEALVANIPHMRLPYISLVYLLI